VIDRRAFLGTLTGSLLAAPLAAEGQQAGKVYKIGLLFNILPPTFPKQWAFYERMMELGWVYGRDFLGEHRVYGDQYERVPHLATELIRAGVDIFVVQGGADASRVQQVTRRIPIVTSTAGDLVAMGLAVSLARPGGNVTGIMQPGLFPKHLSLLKEAIPRLSRLGVLSHGPNPTLPREAEAAGKTLRIALQAVAVQNIDEFNAAFSTFHTEGAQGLVILRDSFIAVNTKKLTDLALRHRLPTISDLPVLAAQGGLITYGYNVPHAARAAADIVDKILRGARASEIPVQQATTFHFVINLKTAKALGLTIPPSLLQRADQVIE